MSLNTQSNNQELQAAYRNTQKPGNQSNTEVSCQNCKKNIREGSKRYFNLNCSCKFHIQCLIHDYQLYIQGKKEVLGKLQENEVLTQDWKKFQCTSHQKQIKLQELKFSLSQNQYDSFQSEELKLQKQWIFRSKWRDYQFQKCCNKECSFFWVAGNEQESKCGDCKTFEIGQNEDIPLQIYGQDQEIKCGDCKTTEIGQNENIPQQIQNKQKKFTKDIQCFYLLEKIELQNSNTISPFKQNQISQKNQIKTKTFEIKADQRQEINQQITISRKNNQEQNNKIIPIKKKQWDEKSDNLPKQEENKENLNTQNQNQTIYNYQLNTERKESVEFFHKCLPDQLNIKRNDSTEILCDHGEIKTYEEKKENLNTQNQNQTSQTKIKGNNKQCDKYEEILQSEQNQKQRILSFSENDEATEEYVDQNTEGCQENKNFKN